MATALEFLIGLLDDDEPCVAGEDLEGEHGSLLKTMREAGFLGREPFPNPHPTCPYCYEGVPYRLGGRYLCASCRSTVAREHLLLWRFDREAFLRSLAGQFRLRGGVRRIDDRLWQLGSRTEGSGTFESFYRRPGPLSQLAGNRLSSFRSVLVFYGLTPPPDAEFQAGYVLSLLEVLDLEDSLTVRDLRPLLRPRGNVRFDASSGTLWAAGRWLGEVPLRSREFYFLAALGSHLDRVVSYADIKHAVLRESGSSDESEEATFCQRLKNRVKKKCVPEIDRIIVTTNKGAGYRMRAYVSELQGP
jgi:hypothetical protein